MKKNSITSVILIVAVIVVTGIISLVAFRATFAAGTYKVIFHYAESSKGIVKTCRTNSSGKISDGCAAYADNVCRSWSPEAWDGYSNPSTQGNQKSTSTIADIAHTSNTTYYCVAHKSTGKVPACLICLSDSSIYQWGLYNITNGQTHLYSQDNGTGDSCTGWKYDYYNTTEDSCSQCFQCKADSNVYKWSSDAWGDADCPGGYKKTNKSKSNCVSTPPPSTPSNPSTPSTPSTPDSACYVCKADNHIMKWATSGEGDNQCAGGYEKTNKSQAECKNITEACYECKADKNIVKWAYDGTGDNSCPGGYNKTTLAKDKCVNTVPENPPTGSFLLMITWIVASISIGLSLWYLKNSARV